MEKLRFAKMYEDVRIPTKRDEDAGWDIYPHFEEEAMVIEPHQTVLVSTGLRVWIPKGYFMRLLERGSNGSRGLGQRAGVIDENYTGEIFVAITNHNDRRVIIYKESDNEELNHSLFESQYIDNHILYPYSKAICQGVILPVPQFEVEEVDEEVIKNRTTNRGEGALGSSGK